MTDKSATNSYESDPVAWELQVRGNDTKWQRYNIYDTLRGAEDSTRRIECKTILVRIIPLRREYE